MAQFQHAVDIETTCWMQGGGFCCRDRHMQSKAVMPDEPDGMVLCDTVNDTLTPGRLTDDKTLVTCQLCREILHS